MANSNLATHSREMCEDINRQLRILILDDDAFDRQRLRRQASKFAFPTIVEEADGLFLLEEKLDKETFDVVLIDYNLAAGNGIEALEIIANHPINNSAAMIMVAGAPQVDVAVQAMKHGCDEFISKVGLNANQLQKTILDAVLASTRKAGTALCTDLEDISNALANGAAEIFLMAMRPKLTRMQRHIAILEDHANIADRGTIDVIAQSCRVLEDFLGEIENQEPDTAESANRIVPLK